MQRYISRHNSCHGQRPLKMTFLKRLITEAGYPFSPLRDHALATIETLLRSCNTEDNPSPDTIETMRQRLS